VSGEALYRMLRRGLDVTVWGGELEDIGGWPISPPAVIVANHARALGPIAVMASIPQRLYPWLTADMLDFDLAPQYLRGDFVEPELHIPSAVSMAVSTALSQVTVRLLRSIECVPVWSDRKLVETYELSAQRLSEVSCLLVFPEDPTLSGDELTGMRPFKTGFARIGQFYFELTRKRLRFYPVAVLRRQRRVRIGKAITYNPINQGGREWVRLARLLETMIREMILGESIGLYAGVPLPH
jgi:hypothetical protein